MGSVRQLSGRGTLFLDFRYCGQRCREYTALPDTPTNRKRLEKALAKMGPSGFLCVRRLGELAVG